LNFIESPTKPIIKKIENWDVVLRLKDREERLKEINRNLEQGQFKEDNFRRRFINFNKNWLRENLELVFSPRTRGALRKEILASFQQIYGSLVKEKCDDKEVDNEEDDQEEELKKQKN